MAAGSAGWLLVALLSASLSLLFCQCADVAADLYPTARHERGPYGAVGRLAAVCPRHVVLHALADYRLFKRRSVVPKHYIIWLLITLLLAIKAFAFSPVSDVLALRQLLFPLLAAALLAPYFRRSQRVKRTLLIRNTPHLTCCRWYRFIR